MPTGFMQSSRRDIRTVYPETVIKPLIEKMAAAQAKLSSDVATGISPQSLLSGQDFANI